jgi:multidrug resistance efflux pump
VASSFSRTTRALEGEKSATLLVGTAMLTLVFAGWCAWAVWGRLTLHVVSTRGRLEVAGAAHPLHAQLAGRLVEHQLGRLGARVGAGDVLATLDDESERRQLAAERANLESLEGRATRFALQVAADERALATAEKAADAARQEALARAAEADAADRLSTDRRGRAESLSAAGAISSAQAVEARESSEQAHSHAVSEGAAAQRSLLETERDLQDRRTGLERRRGELAEVQGLKAVSRERARVLEYELERHLVRSPVEGWVADVAVLPAGAYVDEGTYLGSIVPLGEVRAVGYFDPSEASGRVRTGQLARVELDAFPWTQFGVIAARVTHTALEPRDGTLRVELALEPDARLAAPIEHGLPATIEVDVEETSPLALAVRAAGKLLDAAPRRAAPQQKASP